MDGPAFFAYATNYWIHVQAGIMVDVEATPAWRTAEVKSTRTMIERVEQRFDFLSERLIGDTAYGAAQLRVARSRRAAARARRGGGQLPDFQVSLSPSETVVPHARSMPQIWPAVSAVVAAIYVGSRRKVLHGALRNFRLHIIIL